MISRPRGRRAVNLQILPSAMTVLSICAGLTSIRFALEHQPKAAMALIAAAAILDGLDGRVARDPGRPVTNGRGNRLAGRRGELRGDTRDRALRDNAVQVAGRMDRGAAVRGVRRVAAGEVQRAAGRRDPAGLHARILRRDARAGGRGLDDRPDRAQTAVRRGLVDVDRVPEHLGGRDVDAVGQQDPDEEDARRGGPAELGGPAAGGADDLRGGRSAEALPVDLGDHRRLPVPRPVRGAQPTLARQTPRGVGRQTRSNGAQRGARYRRAQPHRRSVARLGLRKPSGRLR